MFVNHFKYAGVTPEVTKSKDTEEDLTEDITDWKIPLAFSKKRHSENIEGGYTITQTWRMKERVKCFGYLVFLTYSIVYLIKKLIILFTITIEVLLLVVFRTYVNY